MRQQEPAAKKEKVSTGMLLNQVMPQERRIVAREMHESLLDLPSVWAPAEVFVHESISYRLKGRAFVHMAPPLETEGVEIHILEGLYALHTLLEMAKNLPVSAQTEVVEKPPHRHTKGGELVVRVTTENLQDVFRFVFQLYCRERGT